jgi:hypothetical protein
MQRATLRYVLIGLAIVLGMGLAGYAVAATFKEPGSSDLGPSIVFTPSPEATDSQQPPSPAETPEPKPSPSRTKDAPEEAGQTPAPDPDPAPAPAPGPVPPSAPAPAPVPVQPAPPVEYDDGDDGLPDHDFDDDGGDD